VLIGGRSLKGAEALDEHRGRLDGRVDDHPSALGADGLRGVAEKSRGRGAALNRLIKRAFFLGGSFVTTLLFRRDSIA
jgi:hypothetical protein